MSTEGRPKLFHVIVEREFSWYSKDGTPPSTMDVLRELRKSSSDDIEEDDLTIIPTKPGTYAAGEDATTLIWGDHEDDLTIADAWKAVREGAAQAGVDVEHDDVYDEDE